MKRLQLLFTTLLLPLDILALLGGFSLAYYIRNQYVLLSPEDLSSIADKLQYHSVAALLPFDNYVHYLSFIIPGMVVVFALVGLYAMRSSANWWQRALRILIGVSAGECGILFLFLLKKDFFLPRTTLLYSWVLCTVFVIVVRALISGVQQWLYYRGIGQVRTAVLGKNESSRRVVEHLRRTAKYRVVKEYEDGVMDTVIRALDAERVDELVVVSQQYTNEELIRLRNHCLEHHVAFSFVPPLLTELESIFEVQTVAGLPAIEVRPTPLEGWGRVVKRTFDVIVSLFFLILLSPVFLLIAIWIKLASPGPLIYKHRRIGRDERPIDVWKFRSMHWEYCTGNARGDAAFEKLLQENPDLAEEWRTVRKLKNDPRISLPGKFLRKSSLDELPQFFNVLRGELSLVGPRAIVKDEVVRYGEKARILFSVRPGLTGLWQVSGRSDVSYEERIALDSRYIEHWTLWTDLVVLFKTCLVVLGDILGTVIGRKSTAY